MFGQSYAKFYTFIVLALIVGFIGMEVATTGVSLGDEQLTGMATHTIEGAEPLLGGGAQSLVYFLLGVLVGTIIVGTVVFVYAYEKKRLY